MSGTVAGAVLSSSCGATGDGRRARLVPHRARMLPPLAAAAAAHMGHHNIPRVAQVTRIVPIALNFLGRGRTHIARRNIAMMTHTKVEIVQRKRRRK